VHTYLIRYGLMGHVGRFAPLPECDTAFERGHVVVVRSSRGVELGEVLIALFERSDTSSFGAQASTPTGDLHDDASENTPAVERPHVVRRAGEADLAQERRAAESRQNRFDQVRRVLDEADWPWELLDVEPLLDGRSIVLHYLGPHQVDVASWRARFRAECDLDVVLEPVGSDAPHDDAAAGAFGNERGCGNCGCGEGGCGSEVAPAAAAHEHVAADSHGCSPRAHAGCASCGIGKLIAAQRP
jgi:hypothetical protein